MHLHIFSIKQLFTIRLKREKILKTIKEIIINLSSFYVCYFIIYSFFLIIKGLNLSKKLLSHADGTYDL